MSAKHTTYFKLLEALKEGCPICFLMNAATHKLMDSFLHENVNDAGLRQEIKNARGFCNRHAWQLRKFGDVFGQAIVYSDLMDSAGKELEVIKNLASHKKRPKKTGPREICMFCKQEKNVEERYIPVFWENFNDNDAEFSSHYKNSFGLCLPHLNTALAKCKDSESAEKLIDIEKEKISGLITELKEFIRKHDYRFSKERFGSESNSLIRTIEKFIGKKGV